MHASYRDDICLNAFQICGVFRTFIAFYQYCLFSWVGRQPKTCVVSFSLLIHTGLLRNAIQCNICLLSHLCGNPWYALLATMLLFCIQPLFNQLKSRTNLKPDLQERHGQKRSIKYQTTRLQQTPKRKGNFNNAKSSINILLNKWKWRYKGINQHSWAPYPSGLIRIDEMLMLMD